MNLTKLFETQRVLRDRIGYNEPDRFNKLILALLVELGECANEWRGFKFWSVDQEPRNSCFACGNYSKPKPGLACPGCGGYGVNPLLEEYVDGLHFVLEIGLEIGCEFYEPFKRITLSNRVTDKFNAVFKMAANLDIVIVLIDPRDYKLLLTEYIELGEQLGFTWEQIEEAYYKKNQINHTRQDNGY